MAVFDAEKVKNECVAWICRFFEENGPGCNAVLGISGGKDSSVAAALCVEALGKDRVIGAMGINLTSICRTCSVRILASGTMW
mgnify:CR=1 FL=1